VTVSVALRPLCHEDLGFLCEVRHHPQTLPYLHDPRVFSLDEAQRWFSRERPEWLIVEAAGAMAGYVRLSDRDRVAQSIKVGMDIHPAYRRRGIATAAYRELIRRLQADGYKKLWLEVLAPNSAARALYEKLGFRYDPELRRVVLRDGRPCASLAMFLSLDAVD